MSQKHGREPGARAYVARRLSKRFTAWDQLRQDTGIVIGFDGKTRKASTRCCASMSIVLGGSSPTSAARRTMSARKSSTPSPRRSTRFATCGSFPYTARWRDAHVTSGRVANVFNLNGPNLVLDAEGRSLYEALAHAERHCVRGHADHAGSAISSAAGAYVERLVRSRDQADQRVLGKRRLWWRSRGVYREGAWVPILGYLSASAQRPRVPKALCSTSGPAVRHSVAAEGALDSLTPFERLGKPIVPQRFVARRGNRQSLEIALTSARRMDSPREQSGAQTPTSPPSAGRAAAPMAAPRWVPAAVPASPDRPWTRRRLSCCRSAHTVSVAGPRAALGRSEYRVSAVDRAVPGGIAIDSPTTRRRHARFNTRHWPYDAIVV